jgi:hypothetical protein
VGDSVAQIDAELESALREPARAVLEVQHSMPPFVSVAQPRWPPSATHVAVSDRGTAKGEVPVPRVQETVPWVRRKYVSRIMRTFRVPWLVAPPYFLSDT